MSNASTIVTPRQIEELVERLNRLEAVVHNALDQFEPPDDGAGYAFRSANGLTSPWECATEFQAALEVVSTECDGMKRVLHLAA